MGGKEWTTTLQKLFLLNWLNKYLEAAATGSYAKFWPPLYEAWFQENVARLAPLPDSPDDDDEHMSDDEEASLGRKAHVNGLTSEGRQAWRVQHGIIRDQKVPICVYLYHMY